MIQKNVSDIGSQGEHTRHLTEVSFNLCEKLGTDFIARVALNAPEAALALVVL